MDPRRIEQIYEGNNFAKAVSLDTHAFKVGAKVSLVCDVNEVYPAVVIGYAVNPNTNQQCNIICWLREGGILCEALVPDAALMELSR